MIRKGLPIGFVILARLFAQAQSDPALADPNAPTKGLSSYRFDGQLVYRSSDGTFVPVFPDAVFIGWGDDGCDLSHQSSERLNFFPDGVFQLTVFELTTTILRLDGGPSGKPGYTKVGANVVQWPCYRFRVEGCDDGVLQFGATPPERNVELNCPGREFNPRRDG